MWRRFWWTAYDHLGGVVVFNLVWAVVVLPWMGVAWLMVRWGLHHDALAAFGCGILSLLWVSVSPPTALLFVAARHWVEGSVAPWSSVLREWWRQILRVQALGVAFGAAGTVLVVNMGFWIRLGSGAGAVLGYSFAWLAIFLVLMVPYVVALRVRGEESLRGVLQHSLALATEQPLVTLMLGGAGAGMIAGAGLSGIGLVAGMVSLWALLATTVVSSTLARRGNCRLPPLEHRSWRELLRPWGTP